MIILSLRTDKPEAELGLCDDERQLNHLQWIAHRQLSVTLHHKIDDLLNQSSKSRSEIEGIVVYEGPGSFTGLRIGFSVANAMAYALNIPIVASAGLDWIESGIKNIQSRPKNKLALPHYGSPPHITQPKK